MNPQAQTLNRTIQNLSPTAYNLLSRTGKKLFFPSKGIVSQSAEATQHADQRYNATIGIALKDGRPIGFPSIRKYFSEELENKELFSYTGSGGNPALRRVWQERIVRLNPLLKEKPISLPIVTAGLTQALYLAAQLFIDEGQAIVLPDQLWGNYRLMMNVLTNAQLRYFPFFKAEGFNLSAYREALRKEGESTGSVRTILNFPNNPTGYAPTQNEAEGIVSVLNELAEQGIQILVILDEAYFGLFFENNVYQYSLFSMLADAHKNILSIKICGATKELFVWGFRIGFITFATQSATAEFYNALEQKAMGALRGSISNCSTPAQNIILKALISGESDDDFKANYELLQTRITEVKRVLSDSKYATMFKPYPFNSGYFMLVKLAEGLNAETLRQHLLHKDGIGVIATSESDIRIAFSCLEREHIRHVFDRLYAACQTLMQTQS